MIDNFMSVNQSINWFMSVMYVFILLICLSLLMWNLFHVEPMKKKATTDIEAIKNLIIKILQAMTLFLCRFL